MPGEPINCDDGNPCTVDSCDATGGCRNEEITCDDGNECTRDFCSGLTGACLSSPRSGTLCDDNDGSACTRGVCDNGACSQVPVLCDDQNACTRDSCDPTDGCQRQFICDDGNDCTVDACTGAATGCANQPVVGMGCDDRNACTTGDVCVADPAQGASCRGTGPSCEDGNPCTQDVAFPEGAQCECLNLPLDNACCSVGDPVPCDDANACTSDRCDAVSGCAHDIMPAPVTCGAGICERHVDACAGGLPQECVPGTPKMEMCNGLDDDCDGHTDENRLAVMCTFSPKVIRVPPRMTTLAVTCTFRDRCAGRAPLPLEGVVLDRAWISRADRLGSLMDNEMFPDPATLTCPAPGAVETGERGIAENPDGRAVTGNQATFEFTLPSDGLCATLDGDRSSLADLLASLPDGSLAVVCVGSRFDGVPFQGCGTVRVRNSTMP